jgi:hypothetical protein
LPETKQLFNAVCEPVNANMCRGGPAVPCYAVPLIGARNSPSKIGNGTGANRDPAR